ncbi:ankyrin repeat domain-containing protein [Mucilaginibacter pallidiroseus]|uniref:Ankyrin repeat domain-containing protein n=1 Tax=Mucilaginibacter pallidiroseus TaxID=2599295 RepID=A0A563U2Y4_9SPHI|nr:ankyrin repeat domain-containing protein [Mucilaginibacter pallidiroseus]TWR25706.1 ankyrin repeat domain-containing protein [Mucilaginibacter pallidiroseus]
MKRILIAILVMVTLSAQAQQNPLLDQSFWKSKPSAAAVKAEVDKGADPAQKNGSAFDPVVMAINADAPNETIKYLIDQPGNPVDKITHDGRIYMHWAAYRGNVEIIEYLLSKGSKINIDDAHGYSVLNFAATAGQTNTKIYDLCFANGVNAKTSLTPDGANALLLGVANDKDMVLTNYFVSKGLDIKSVDAAGNTAFNYAARAGNIDMMKALKEKGVPYTDNAMLMAAQGTRRGANGIEVYQYLESLKIKPTAVGKNGETALHAVVRRPGQLDIIKYFLSKGVNVNQADDEGNTPFMLAAASNSDTATIALLASSVKNINLANKKGVTALAYAVRGNSAAVVSYLISKGANVNVTDASGDNLAAYLMQSYSPQRAESFEAKLKVLQDKGFAVNAPQKNGNTLYHMAVAKNDLALLRRIESLNVDVNAKNKEGFTALHKAAMLSKDDAILKYLVSIGAKKEIATDFKETAFDLASENESLSKNKVSVTFLK